MLLIQLKCFVNNLFNDPQLFTERFYKGRKNMKIGCVVNSSMLVVLVVTAGFFKILHGIYDSEVSEDILQLSKNTVTRGHSLKLATLPSRLEIRRNNFAVRDVKRWNSLPEKVVTASSVRGFENRLDTFWKDQPVKYNFREELRT